MIEVDAYPRIPKGHILLAATPTAFGTVSEYHEHDGHYYFVCAIWHRTPNPVPRLYNIVQGPRHSETAGNLGMADAWIQQQLGIHTPTELRPYACPAEIAAELWPDTREGG